MAGGRAVETSPLLSEIVKHSKTKTHTACVAVTAIACQVTVARLLPLVYASTENRKDPFHERRGWLHQCHVLRNTVPVRNPYPIVTPEFPQVVVCCRR